jgi:hypothetical protein
VVSEGSKVISDEAVVQGSLTTSQIASKKIQSFTEFENMNKHAMNAAEKSSAFHQTE